MGGILPPLVVDLWKFGLAALPFGHRTKLEIDVLAEMGPRSGPVQRKIGFPTRNRRAKQRASKLSADPTRSILRE